MGKLFIFRLIPRIDYCRRLGPSECCIPFSRRFLRLEIACSFKIESWRDLHIGLDSNSQALHPIGRWRSVGRTSLFLTSWREISQTKTTTYLARHLEIRARGVRLERYSAFRPDLFALRCAHAAVRAQTARSVAYKPSNINKDRFRFVSMILGYLWMNE
ncbi:hypothetical protein MPH_13996 [Macrophomina phaseolina MS6]|uniref:Uncharacterized protein n=1 Tax=Macrophomina phaseolina (strain MS6) TaxID=1126212 RepID=K2R4E8_MACPH|nr:hypothetical protein MPH_13996 [Macrophomina phaseolina MS6]